MKLLVLTTGKLKDEKKSDGQRIYELAKERGCDVYYINPKDLSYYIDQEKIEIFYNGQNVTDVDVILIRRMTRGEAEMHEAIRVFKLLNKIIIGESLNCPFPINKINQQLIETSLFPKSFYFKKEDNVFLSIEEKIGIPFLIKPANGSNGRGIDLINNEEEFKNYLEETVYNFFIAQEYLDIDIECRVLILDEKSLGVCKKESDGLVRNASRGGIFKKIKDEELEKIAIEYAKKFNCGGVVGVDIVRTKNNRIYLLEINNCPGVSSFEKATGINIREKIINYCLDKYNKK